MKQQKFLPRFFAFAAFISLISLIRAGPWKFTINQPLDHFDNSIVAIFNQTYYVWDDHWDKPNGPLIILIGYASPLQPGQFLNAGTHTEVTKKYRGLLIAVEQRGFGDSLNSEMLKKAFLHYLNIRQMLGDVAVVQKKVMKEYEVSKSSVKIAFGYSFGGLFSTFYRLKYPDLVDAAFVSSGPVLVDYDAYKYWSNLGWKLADSDSGGSDECFEAVKKAFAEVDRKLSSPANFWQEIGAEFKFCTPFLPNGNVTDKDVFVVALHISGSIMNLAYFSNVLPNVNYKNLVCPMMTNKSSTPYEALKLLNAKMMTAQKKSCLNASWDQFMEDKLRYKNGIEDWDYYKV